MNPLSHYTFVEEITLLALDDAAGTPLAMPPLAFSYALAGAILCDLSELNRIDTDPEKLVVLNSATTCDPILDQALALLASATQTESVSRWLGVLSEQSRVYHRAATDRLVARGVLRREEAKILWVFGTRRYPTVDNHERIEVRTRLSALILGDDLPDPRDATLLSLLAACQLTGHIFNGAPFAARAERIATLAKMDLVGREVAGAIEAIARAMSATVAIGM
ncbi:MAG: GPP34 family phosphoprotein [Verrucomicrobiota bacterium]|jgi:hypothetical protein